MFNNLINIHDFQALLRNGPRTSLKKLKSVVSRGEKERTEQAWAHIETPVEHWWEIPAVVAEWNSSISDDPNVDYYEYVSQKHLVTKDSLKALSLGCGTGHRELRWAKSGRFKRIDAYDLSETRIEHATDVANQSRYNEIINYRVGDIYNIDARENYYDVVLGEHSLHHFSPLEELFTRINRFLAPNGHFIINDFVGPTRFQWTKKQIEISNALLAIFPDKYKRLRNNAKLKSKVRKPSKLRMLMDDPSEAVESSNILPLLKKTFDVVEIKEYGGTILQILLNGIAQNFCPPDEISKRLLRSCIEVEAALLASGDISSDFVVAICKKRTSN